MIFQNRVPYLVLHHRPSPPSPPPRLMRGAWFLALYPKAQGPFLITAESTQSRRNLPGIKISRDELSEWALRYNPEAKTPLQSQELFTDEQSVLLSVLQMTLNENTDKMRTLRILAELVQSFGADDQEKLISYAEYLDNMLSITNDGRKLGLDQRLINPNFPDFPGSKVNKCVDNIVKIWEDGQTDKLTQLVFCDLSTPKGKAAATKDKTAMTAGDKTAGGAELHALDNLLDVEPDAPFSVYEDVRDKLIARGIPTEQIAFIHDANTDAKKKELFAKVRSGKVRVLMGSTFKMGAV